MMAKPVPNLYTTDDWIDIESIAATGCWMIVIIGSRQVGKTYGVIKYLLDHNCYHIYMRRTIDEMDLITEDPELNPYDPLLQEGYQVTLAKQGKGWIIADYELDDEGVRQYTERRGIGLPLSRIAKVRGFSGGRYTDLLLDEFIPEEMVVVRKAEGDAFRNALITIEGNRTQQGLPPLRVWMLANANDLFSPIMISMNLVNEVESMMRKNEELRILKSGVCIVLPKSKNAIRKRMDDPLISFLHDDSQLSQMAFNNSFSYNDTSLVKPKNIRGWKPYLRTTEFYIWENGSAFYVSQSPHHKGPIYGATRDEQLRCGMEYPFMTMFYRSGKITFSDAVSLYKFKKYFNIK